MYSWALKVITKLMVNSFVNRLRLATSLFSIEAIHINLCLYRPTVESVAEKQACTNLLRFPRAHREHSFRMRTKSGGCCRWEQNCFATVSETTLVDMANYTMQENSAKSSKWVMMNLYGLTTITREILATCALMFHCLPLALSNCYLYTSSFASLWGRCKCESVSLILLKLCTFY